MLVGEGSAFQIVDRSLTRNSSSHVIRCPSQRTTCSLHTRTNNNRSATVRALPCPCHLFPAEACIRKSPSTKTTAARWPLVRHAAFRLSFHRNTVVCQRSLPWLERLLRIAVVKHPVSPVGTSTYSRCFEVDSFRNTRSAVPLVPLWSFGCIAFDSCAPKVDGTC